MVRGSQGPDSAQFIPAPRVSEIMHYSVSILNKSSWKKKKSLNQIDPSGRTPVRDRLQLVDILSAKQNHWISSPFDWDPMLPLANTNHLQNDLQNQKCDFNIQTTLSMYQQTSIHTLIWFLNSFVQKYSESRKFKFVGELTNFYPFFSCVQLSSENSSSFIKDSEKCFQ